jgi:hypothetical protein
MGDDVIETGLTRGQRLITFLLILAVVGAASFATWALTRPSSTALPPLACPVGTIADQRLNECMLPDGQPVTVSAPAVFWYVCAPHGWNLVYNERGVNPLKPASQGGASMAGKVALPLTYTYLTRGKRITLPVCRRR